MLAPLTLGLAPAACGVMSDDDLTTSSSSSSSRITRMKYLTRAVMWHDYSCAEKLLRSNQYDADEVDTSLQMAVIFGFEDLVHLLISHKADVNFTNSSGETPLHMCAKIACNWGVSPHRSINIIDMLVNAGADVNAVSSTGMTPLMVACEKGSCVAAACLLRNPDVDVNFHHSISGETALHFAAQYPCLYCGERIPLVQRMIEMRDEIDVNARTALGRTALHDAVNGRRHKNAEVLALICGVDIQAKDCNGKTAYDLVFEADPDSLKRMLCGKPVAPSGCMAGATTKAATAINGK